MDLNDSFDGIGTEDDGGDAGGPVREFLVGKRCVTQPVTV